MRVKPLSSKFLPFSTSTCFLNIVTSSALSTYALTTFCLNVCSNQSKFVTYILSRHIGLFYFLSYLERLFPQLLVVFHDLSHLVLYQMDYLGHTRSLVMVLGTAALFHAETGWVLRLKFRHDVLQELRGVTVKIEAKVRIAHRLVSMRKSAIVYCKGMSLSRHLSIGVDVQFGATVVRALASTSEGGWVVVGAGGLLIDPGGAGRRLLYGPAATVQGRDVLLTRLRHLVVRVHRHVHYLLRDRWDLRLASVDLSDNLLTCLHGLPSHEREAHLHGLAELLVLLHHVSHYFGMLSEPCVPQGVVTGRTAFVGTPLVALLDHHWRLLSVDVSFDGPSPFGVGRLVQVLASLLVNREKRHFLSYVVDEVFPEELAVDDRQVRIQITQSVPHGSPASLRRRLLLLPNKQGLVGRLSELGFHDLLILYQSWNLVTLLMAIQVEVLHKQVVSLKSGLLLVNSNRTAPFVLLEDNTGCGCRSQAELRICNFIWWNLAVVGKSSVGKAALAVA